MTMIYPTKEIVDDYMIAVAIGLCTRNCGAARDDICKCRCEGEFHNLLRDWWASPEYRRTSLHWCRHCQSAHAGNRCVGQHQCAPTCPSWKELTA